MPRPGRYLCPRTRPTESRAPEPIPPNPVRRRPFLCTARTGVGDPSRRPTPSRGEAARRAAGAPIAPNPTAHPAGGGSEHTHAHVLHDPCPPCPRDRRRGRGHARRGGRPCLRGRPERLGRRRRVRVRRQLVDQHRQRLLRRPAVQPEHLEGVRRARPRRPRRPRHQGAADRGRRAHARRPGPRRLAHLRQGPGPVRARGGLPRGGRTGTRPGSRSGPGSRTGSGSRTGPGPRPGGRSGGRGLRRHPHGAARRHAGPDRPQRGRPRRVARLWAANRDDVRNPNRIRVGQVLQLP